MLYDNYMISRHAPFVVLVLVLLPSLGVADNKFPWYEYEPTSVTLQGTLESAWAYGPPNYGENPTTDKKEVFYLLKLEGPINVRGKPNDSLNPRTNENISEIQVIPGDLNLKRFENKKVSVMGALFASITGHHHTKVLITATYVSLRGSPRYSTPENTVRTLYEALKRKDLKTVQESYTIEVKDFGAPFDSYQIFGRKIVKQEDSFVKPGDVEIIAENIYKDRPPLKIAYFLRKISNEWKIFYSIYIPDKDHPPEDGEY